METGLDLLEEGRNDSRSLIYNARDAMNLANRIDELSTVFEYVTYDSDDGQASNIMQVNVPLLARYMAVRESMTGPEGPGLQEGHHYPQPAARIVPESDYIEVSPATMMIENLEAELLSGVSTDRANEITEELLGRMGDGMLDRILELVHQGKLSMEAKRHGYEMELSGWLDDNIDTPCSALDIDKYTELMGKGAVFPEVVRRYGDDIRNVQMRVAVKGMDAHLHPDASGEESRYSKAAEASKMVNRILGGAFSLAVGNDSGCVL